MSQFKLHQTQFKYHFSWYKLEHLVDRWHFISLLLIFHNSISFRRWVSYCFAVWWLVVWVHHCCIPHHMDRPLYVVLCHITYVDSYHPHFLMMWILRHNNFLTVSSLMSFSMYHVLFPTNMITLLCGTYNSKRNVIISPYTWSNI